MRTTSTAGLSEHTSFKVLAPDRDSQASLLPENFLRWFAGRGWSPREHQLALLAKARDDLSALLIAPTGAGKTLAGFLPTLVELSSPARAAPLPPRSGGEGSGVGGLSTRSHTHVARVETPPTPDPSPPRAARAGGVETTAYAAKSARSEFISSGRGVPRSRGLHTLYISPLKALAVDIARNLATPVSEMGLAV